MGWFTPKHPDGAEPQKRESRRDRVQRQHDEKMAARREQQNPPITPEIRATHQRNAEARYQDCSRRNHRNCIGH